MPIERIAVTAVVAGIFGGAAMIAVMRLITRAEWAHFDIVVALGSLVTRSREGAYRVGAAIHACSAVGFALLYCVLLLKFGVAHLPSSVFAGVGIGIVHGMVVSLMLVWMVAEQHPLVEFQEAGLAVGLVHFAGHVAYGAVVGLMVGICM